MASSPSAGPQATCILAPPPKTGCLDLALTFGDAMETAPDPARAWNGNLLVDIGCGKGRFLLATAARNPMARFLGIDLQMGRLNKVDQRLRQLGLRNVRLLHVEALHAVKALLPPRSVTVFTVFFPDPWPKRRHHERRLFCPLFLNALHAAMATEGRIYIATDHADYFSEITNLFQGDPRYVSRPPVEPEDGARTHFEVLFLNKGMSICRASFGKALDTAGVQNAHSDVGMRMPVQPVSTAPLT